MKLMDRTTYDLVKFIKNPFHQNYIWVFAKVQSTVKIDIH